MPAPFRFLDRIDALVAGPASVETTVRELVLPGGDRPVTRASDASRIPEDDVRAHVVGVALDVLKTRVRDGLVDALRDHLDEVRAEHELVEGPCPDAPAGSFRRDQWLVNLEAAVVASFRDGDLAVLGHEIIGNALAPGFDPEPLADAVLAAPVADSDAVLARVGLTATKVDAIVAEIRKPPASVIVEVLPSVASEPWSLERLAGSWAFTGEPGDAELFREAATYVLGDPDLIDAGAELLGLAGDEAFLAWARERAAFSDPAGDAADVAEVLRLAGANEEGGGGTERQAKDAGSQPETAAGGDGAGPPAAQKADPKDMLSAFKVMSDAAKDAKLPKPEPAEASDLTRAAGAALAALYDHGCETDKAMAEALGVQKGVVNASRHGKTPWAPDAGQRDGLLGLVTSHLAALQAARDGLLEVF